MSLQRYLFSNAASIVGCALLFISAHPTWPQTPASPSHALKTVSAERGRDLFNGNEPLIGRLRDHSEPLPSEVVTCNHCHATSSGKPVAGSDAPVLDALSLTQFKSRRNAPQSRYDKQSFCKLMRTNVDPVYILVAKQMPIYTIDDDQCESLWIFLTAPPKAASLK